MSDPHVFRDPGCTITPDPRARCRHCGSATGLIEGDGAIVCVSCIRARGQLADDPTGAPPPVLEQIQRLHGDVVRLARIPGSVVRFGWRWIAPWPEAESR